MTTLYKKKVRCAVCGNENEFTGIGSTNRLGWPDLDTRPPEMERSTIFTWVQRCPGCGFCASDISKAPPGAGSLVRASEYQKQLHDRAYPDLANSFLCKAMVDEQMSDYAAAAWALVYAAWACDDAEQRNQARICRSKAAKMLIEAEAHSQKIVEQDGMSTAILIDLLRRSGQYAEAQESLVTRQSAITEDFIIRILGFQATLIKNGDDSCHTIAEALGEEE